MGTTDEKRSKIKEWQEKVETSEIIVEEYYCNLLDEIRETNRELDAFRLVLPYSKISPSIKRKPGLFAHFPYSAKDNICTKDVETTAGSKILEGFIPPYDATVIERMKRNGGVLIGKTNMDEFGFGTFSINSGYGIPKNPYNKKLVTGGSSGGAAAATSVLEYHAAIAESTGGSISCPAAFCGIVGFTPTYGVVSRWGLVDYANSLDKIGVMARYTRDVEIVFSHIVGHDGKDSTLVEYEQVSSVFQKREKNTKIGVVEGILDSCEDNVARNFWRAIDRLCTEYSLEYEPVELPSLKYSIAAYYIISTAEASTNLAKLCGMRYGPQAGTYEKYFDVFFTEHRSKFFGDEAKRRIILGTFARMAGYRDKYYLKALRIRKLMIDQYKQLFKKYCVLATPTMPIIPPPIDRAQKLSPIETYMLDILTVPPNLCGLPHISLPIGYEEAPVGIQYIANHFNERSLFRVGKLWEDTFEYRDPPIKIGVVK